MKNLSTHVQLIVIIGTYFSLIVLKACLGWLLKIRQSEFLESYALSLREQLYRTVSGAK